MSRSSKNSPPAWSGWFLTLALAGPTLADGPATLTIQGGRDLGETPIVIECGRSRPPGDYVLRSSNGKSTLMANVFQDAGKTYLGLVLERVPAQGSLAFQVPDRPEPTRPQAGVELVERGRRVEVRVAGRLLTEYVPDDGPKPYYHPVIGPSGAAMTRSYPMKPVEGEKRDHPHHRSLWFTHGSVNKVDFWSEAPNHGTIRETSRPTVVGGASIGLIRTTDDWVGPDGRKVCEDEHVVRFYATRGARVLDFDLTIKATAGSVTFGDTKEGMFGLRVASSMDVTANRGGRILNAEGMVDKSAWGQPSRWVDYSGPVEGKTVGVAILNHPESFRYPTTWHVRDYGLFAANPFGWHDFGQKTTGEYVLPEGGSIRFRYRVVLHEGDAASASLPAAFESYQAPPGAVLTD